MASLELQRQEAYTALLAKISSRARLFSRQTRNLVMAAIH